jgi:hypothetical protein
MADLPADLAASVNDQAQARMDMNIQGYAKYLTPEAIDSLRASFPGIPPRVSRYDIATVNESGGDFTVDVQYFERDVPFVVRSKWRKTGDAWMVIHAERLWAEGEARPGILSRLAATLLRPLAGLRRR